MMKIAAGLLVFLLLTGCGQNGGADRSAEGDTGKSGVGAPENTETAAGDTQKGYILADDVNIHEKGDINSSVKDSLNVGTAVGILSVSGFTQVVGGYDDYWYEVEYSGRTGWCYGEFISTADELDENIKRRFDAFFGNGNNKVAEALSALSGYMKLGAGTDTMDEGIRRITELQEGNAASGGLEGLDQGEITGLYSYSIEDLNNPEKIKDTRLKSIVGEIRSGGYYIDSSEGTYYLVQDPDFMLDKYGQGISEGMKEFLELKSVEVKNRILEDGGLLCSPDELADRIAGWERYIAEYPGTKEAEEAGGRYYKPYLGFYLMGIDNTPYYDYETHVLKDDVRASYERFMEEYAETSAYETVSGYYEVLKRNAFKQTAEVVDYAGNLLQKLK